jgi:putative SOS response-associated peptidase YedK
MCGRYDFGLSSSKKGKQIRERAEKMNLVFKEGEVFPNDDVLCMIPVGSKIDLSVKKWGIKNKSFQINARVESLDDRPSYASMKDKRCAVICNGFYEWDSDKNKYYVNTEDEYIYLACIFNDADELLILTKAAEGDFARIHSRTPIIMDQGEMLRFIHNETGTIREKKLHFQIKDDELKLF